MLMRRWDRAQQGDGQLMLIVREPGIGKSRLIEEFHARLRETPHTWAEWSCSLLQNTPLQRFGGADVAAEQRLAELESTLTQIKLEPAENVPLLAPLLDIPLPQERAPALAPRGIAAPAVGSADGPGDGQRTGSAAGAGTRRCALGRPDHARCLRGIAERGALAPLFVLITARRIKEGKGAINWTRLSCRTFAANAVRLQLHALAYNLGNFLRTLATPEPIKDWSLISLKEKLIKIGAKVVSHGRYVAFQMAEVAIPRQMFQEILRLIAELRPQPPPAPA